MLVSLFHIVLLRNREQAFASNVNESKRIFGMRNIFTMAVMAGGLAAPVMALEYPIGTPQEGGGMEVAAVYLQPVEMAPEGMMRPAADSDIHLEADIKALADNPNGFAEGEWVPYLGVAYKLKNVKTGEEQKGEFMAMVANDGPHYGDNVKLMGPGEYQLELTVSPPSANPHTHFGRHTDKETGVAEWFEPFTLSYDFVYAGTGKKGGY